jgi:hypothetical protein
MTTNSNNSMISLFTEYCRKPLPSGEQVSFPQQVFQWLKLLSFKSDNKVGFRLLSERRFVVFTAYRLFQNNPPSFGGYPLNILLPFRSMCITVTDDDIELCNYTVKQIINTDNESFIKLMEDENRVASVSYEGSVVVAFKEGDSWTFRTTTRTSSSEIEYDELNTTLFNKFKGACTVEQLDALHELYPNHSFAFVLTNSDRYLCDYSQVFNGPTVILIGVRDSNSLEVQFEQNIFRTSTIVDVNQVKTFFAMQEHNYFTNNYLNLQGFVFTDANGRVFRTFTRAYHAGTIKVPNNPNFFLGALQSYLRGSLHIYLQFKNHLEDYDEIKADCSNVANGIRSIVQFLFSYFTDLKFNNLSGIWKKSFDKLNGEAYTALFNDNKDGKSSYKKVLAGVQSFAIKNRMNLFNNPGRLETDVYSYVRTLAEKDSDFELIIEIFSNYQSFRIHMFQIVGDIFNNKFEGSLYQTFDRYLKKPEVVSAEVASTEASASAASASATP